MKHKKIMIQGTGSSTGKSVIVAGIGRIFYKDGYSVAPFKSQNMALNSYIDIDGLEMGRAQVVQAEACNTIPRSFMNPILMKPNSDNDSQIIINGIPYKNMDAKEYFSNTEFFKNIAKKSYEIIEEKFDIGILEGGGSPAEMNLREFDLVNMGMAELIDAPVILVGDIERGGVFASIYGTILMLDKKDRDRIKGIIINKFRGDIDLLLPGIDAIAKRLVSVPTKSVDVSFMLINAPLSSNFGLF
ncbi:MAG: cobyric acid synthase, partial [Fusobacteria bacterium]